jgi:hypothetical protein
MPRIQSVATIRRNLNHIAVFGDLKLDCLDSLLDALDDAIKKAGYSDIHLDFSSVSGLNHSFIPPFSAQIAKYRRYDRASFTLILPRERVIAERTKNLGLAHCIAPSDYKLPKQTATNPAVVHFEDNVERALAVEKVIQNLLKTSQITRAGMNAVDWAINEITDNVLSHANSGVGGFLISHYFRNLSLVEFCVADAGVGISRTLQIPDEQKALTEAVKEGVTKDKVRHQGNGLYGTYSLSIHSSGIFVLRSGRGNLFVTTDNRTQIRSSRYYPGTFVVAQITTSDEGAIASAMRFGGKLHEPGYDFVEKNHESVSENAIVEIRSICSSVGSRESGREAFNYIENVLRLTDSAVVEIDFSEVSIISSSFADEVFGRLFVKLGPITFGSRIKFSNADGNVKTLIDRAIFLRMREPS